MNDLITRIRERFDHESQKKILHEKYQAKMVFAHAGGMWKAGPELLTLLQACSNTDLVILDIYQNPVKVKPEELYKLAQQRWQEQMNAWLIEWDQLRRQR